MWLLFTLVLGIAFCVGQYMAWQQLRAQGLYLATNPNSSFFYVLTFMHVLHLLAGIAGSALPNRPLGCEPAPLFAAACSRIRRFTGIFLGSCGSICSCCAA